MEVFYIFLIAVCIILLNFKIAMAIGKCFERMQPSKDRRINILKEFFNSIKLMKINCYEGYFDKKIKFARVEEFYQICKNKYLDTICVFLWASTSNFL